MPAINHTPGPFVVADDIINEHGNLVGVYIAKQNNGMVGQTFANCLVKKDEQLRANARLFAASPELLALVRRMRSYMDQAGIDAKPESVNPMEKLASDIDMTLARI